MAEQTIPEYETIRAAVAGATWAVEKVLMCYKDEIDRQATVKKRQPDGTFKLERCLCATRTKSTGRQL